MAERPVAIEHTLENDNDPSSRPQAYSNVAVKRSDCRDPKTLSGGISEALITTKFGLVVAIPSLIIHAFLSRTAKGKIDGMEQAAISFTNVLAILQGKPAEEALDQESEEIAPTSGAAEESTQEDGED